MSVKEEQGKKLSLIHLIGLGLGGAIGTGIFILLGYGIAYTGRSIVLVVAAGCFWMVLAYWYEFIMPSIFVLKGGSYSMNQLLFNPLITGVSAWFTVFGAFSFSSYAVATADYLSMLFPGLLGYKTLVAFIVMTLFFLSTVRGSRFVVIMENWVTWLLIAAIVLFLGFGLPRVSFGTFFTNADGGFFRGGFGGFLAAISVMGWACQGTMGAISFAPVIEKPKKMIPTAIIWTNVFLAIIYGLMAMVAAGVLPFEQVAGANLSVTAEAIFPRGIYLFFIVGGGIGAIVSSALGGIGGMRYPFLNIAEDGWLPQVFKKQTKTGYPYVTFFVFYIISILPIVTGMEFDTIISLIMIPSMLLSVYKNYACIKLPDQFPDQWEKRSIRLSKGVYKVFCVLGILASSIVAYNNFVGLTFRDMAICVVMNLFLLGASYMRLKQGAVKQETLDARRQSVIEEALQSE